VITRRRLLGLAAAAALMARPPRAGAETPARGGTLKVIGPEPWTFDPHAPHGGDGAVPLSSLVRRPLFRLGPDLTPMPDLALRAEVSRGGRTYTISLRPGVRWDDRPPLRGREVVAEDARYSLERALRRAPRAARLGPVEAVEAADRHVLRIDLAEAFTPFLVGLAEPWAALLPRELEDRAGDFRTAESLVGCGPFLLDRHEAGVKAVFTRNPGYHARPRPYLDRIEWLFIKERATQLSLFRAGQVDLPFHDGRLGRADASELHRANPAYPIAYWDGLGGRRLALRADRAPLGDVRVRRALALAIHRRRWVAELLGGHGIEDPGPVPAALREWKLSGRALGVGARWLAHDPVLARRLLDEAGLGAGHRIRCAVAPGGGPDSAAELDRLSAGFREIGVELQAVAEEVGRIEDASWGPVEPAAEVDGHLYGAYRTGQPGNRSLVSDPRLDGLLDAQRRAGSRRERKALIDDVQRLVADQVYYLFPPAPQQIASWAPWLRGYRPRASGDRGAQLESVWIAPRP